MEVAARWFARTAIDDTITLITEPHVAPLLRANIWHVRGTDRDLIIDAGLGIASLRTAFPDLFDRELVVIATHAHVDHAGGMGEFDEWCMHEREHSGPDGGEMNMLVRDTYPDIAIRYLADAGYDVPPILIDALPHEGYEPKAFRPPPIQPTGHVAEGDVIALGEERVLTVLHLPGHTPGGVGLWDERRGMLFSGDTIYDGPLLDDLPGASIADYIGTMKRLRALRAKVVHAGHDPSFGRARMIELIDGYLARRDLGRAEGA